jgi:predicted transcriptional regulator
METTFSALDQYRAATQHLPDLSPKQQVCFLKYELFQALQRGNDFQDRARDLEIRVAQLDAPATGREAQLDAFARTLHAQLANRTDELEQARRQYDEEVRRLRLALMASEADRRHLVAIIEKAFDEDDVTSESATPPSVEEATP